MSYVTTDEVLIIELNGLMKVFVSHSYMELRNELTKQKLITVYR